MPGPSWYNKQKNKNFRGPRPPRPPRPPGLRGKAIGLYYRDLHKNDLERNPQKEIITKLVIPNPILQRIQEYLLSIDQLAKKYNLNTVVSASELLDCLKFTKKKNTPEDTDFTKEASQEVAGASNDEQNTKKVKLENSVNSMFQQPSTSTSTGSEEKHSDSDVDYNKALSFRDGGTYKYGYTDLITGTFEEKLEESLSKGIEINIENTAHIKDLNDQLAKEYNEMQKSSRYKEMMKFRQKLPAYKMANEIMQTIKENQVVVISGETGCGKSTQVPQLILDDALQNGRGANLRVLVTQPRRIAASSLAERVASERAERLGNSIGYAVRLEKVDSRKRGSVMFCTTGVLLAELEVNQGLTNLSHVILDEVHERDKDVDMSMCLLKKILKKRKDLKLILMSATLDAERLTSYFDNCPLLHIEGLAYPVQDVFLEELLKDVPIDLDSVSRFTQNRRGGHQNQKMNAADMEKDCQHKAFVGRWLDENRKSMSKEIFQTLLDFRSEELNLDFILNVLIYISSGEPGAVLVFLPGISEITKLLGLMRDSNHFPSSRFDLYGLHSKLPSLEQKRIFERPASGVRKIILATNIAETSITIDDIVYVVDCGKIKIKGLNVATNVSTLNTEWVSIANMRQRRGRAGRCQPGICYHIFTSHRASNLDERLLPELQRSDLLEPVLSLKKLRLGQAEIAFQSFMDWPAMSTVKWAVSHLQSCGALDQNEVLTPLGWHLARLPVHPAAGKLLLLATLFGCLDRAACVAAVWGFKDPWILVVGKQAEVDRTKRDFTQGEPSDHVALSEAMISWERYGRSKSYAYDNFLSNNTLELLSEMKGQFGDNLRQMGFLPTGDVRSSWENRNHDNMSLFKAVVAAALYPNIARATWHCLYSRNPRKSPYAVAHTAEDGRVDFHPSSVVAPSPRERVVWNNPGANWAVFWLKQRSTKLYLHEVTLVYTLPLLFFGELKISEVEENLEECYISIANVKVQCRKDTARLLFELRARLDQVLASKVLSDESSRMPDEFEKLVLKAVIELITAEDEQTDYMKDDDEDSDSSSDYQHHRKRWH